MGNATCLPHAAVSLLIQSNPMLDVVYILIGAVFLGAWILYTAACDHL